MALPNVNFPNAGLPGLNVPGITQPMSSFHFAVSFEFFTEEPVKLSIIGNGKNLREFVGSLNVPRTIMSNLFDFRFTSVSGIGFSKAISSLPTNSEGEQALVPNGTTYTDLVLSRALTTLSPLGEWANEWKNEHTTSTYKGETKTPNDNKEQQQLAESNLNASLLKKKANLIVLLLGSHHQPIMGWSFVKAWPKKYSISNLDANKDDYVKEEITLAYESYTTLDLNLIKNQAESLFNKLI